MGTHRYRRLAVFVLALVSALAGGRASAGPRIAPSGGTPTAPAVGPRGAEPSDGGAGAIPVDGGAASGSEGSQCETIALAHDEVARAFESSIAKLRAEIAEAIARLDALIAAGVDVDTRIAAAEVEVQARASTLRDAVNACNHAFTPTSCDAVPVAQANLDAAVAARDAIVEEKTQVRDAKKERAQLLEEDAALVTQRDDVLQSLAKEKQKALDGCAAADPARVSAALAPLCGVSRVLGGSIVIVADKGERATTELAAIEGTLGLSHRTRATKLLANGRAKLGAIRSALAKSKGKLLVIDGAESLMQTGTRRSARAAQELAAAALQLAPGIIVLRVEGELAPTARALAKSRGWRIAGDASDAIETEICRK